MNLFKTTLSFSILLLARAAILLAQPTDNVVAYYPFNGNANDVSGNNMNGTVTSATLTADRLGKPNAAYSFNGTNALILLPTTLLPENTAFAISFWFEATGNNNTGQTAQIIADFRGQYQVAFVYLQPNSPANPGSIEFYIYSSPTTAVIYTANNSIQLDTWYHIVGNYGSNGMELYLNGVLAGTQTVNPPGAVSGYNNVLGKDYNVSLSRYWVNGSIDELIIYKRKLTAAEVQSIYSTGEAQSEIPGLYAPVTYAYDNAGNLTGCNVITMKTQNMAARRDTGALKPASESQSLDTVNGTSLQDKETTYHGNAGDYKIAIYPNPARHELNVNIQGYEPMPVSTINVYNLSGVLVKTISPVSNTTVIDLSNYPGGVYMLNIILGDKKSEWKIIKE
jgi:hypothetical protein